MTLLLRPYMVKVRGFDPIRYYGRSPAQARARAWRSYTAAYDCTFKHFLTISSISKGLRPKDFGKAIRVSGDPAYFIEREPNSGHVRFVRPNSDQMMLSHPLDVTDDIVVMAL